MSGPKCGGYSVVSAEELRRRELAAARDGYARCAGDLQQLQSAVLAAESAYGKLGVTVPAMVPLRSASPADWNRARDAMTAAIAVARADLDQSVGQARLRVLSAGAGQVTAVLAEEETAVPARTARPAPAGRDALARVLARLPADAPAAVADRCAAMGRHLLAAASPAEAARQLDALRLVVQAEQDRRVAVSRNAAALEQLYRELDGLDTEHARTMRGVLKGLDREAPLPPDLADRVAAVRAEAVAELDRRFVLAAAESALAELGYSVGSDFCTAVPVAGVLLDLPHSARHGLQIRERNQQLMLNVVRFDAEGGRDQVADREAETSFCRDFARLRAALGDAGIDLDMIRADLPGQTPVQVLREPPRTREQSAAASTPRHRERPA